MPKAWWLIGGYRICVICGSLFFIWINLWIEDQRSQSYGSLYFLSGLICGSFFCPQIYTDSWVVIDHHAWAWSYWFLSMGNLFVPELALLWSKPKYLREISGSFYFLSVLICRSFCFFICSRTIEYLVMPAEQRDWLPVLWLRRDVPVFSDH